jgi:hypothetical protein
MFPLRFRHSHEGNLKFSKASGHLAQMRFGLLLRRLGKA